MITSTLGFVGFGALGFAELSGLAKPSAVLGLGNSVSDPGRAIAPAVRIVSEDRLAFPVDPEGGLNVLNNFGDDSGVGGACGHRGIDIGVLTSEVGRRLYACTSGTVLDIQPVTNESRTSPPRGNALLLEDAFGDVYRYHHLDAFVEGMEIGDRVERGEVIGFMGKTGNTSWPHVHFEVRRGGKTGEAVDPVPLLPFPIAGVNLGQPTGCA